MSLAARSVQGADVLGARSGLAHTYRRAAGAVGLRGEGDGRRATRPEAWGVTTQAGGGSHGMAVERARVRLHGRRRQGSRAPRGRRCETDGAGAAAAKPQELRASRARVPVYLL